MQDIARVLEPLHTMSACAMRAGTFESCRVQVFELCVGALPKPGTAILAFLLQRLYRD
jgi:hypothetical protein